MKKTIFRSLTLLLALTWLIPKAQAQVETSTYTRTYNWGVQAATTGLTAGNGFFYQGAATTDAKGTEGVYTVPVPGQDLVLETYYSKGLVYRSNGTTYFSGGSDKKAFVYAQAESSKYFIYGPAIAADDAGTLWIPSVQASASTGFDPDGTGTDGTKCETGTIGAFTYYTERPTFQTAGGQDTEGKRRGVAIPAAQRCGRSDMISAYGDGIGGTGFIWFVDGTHSQVVRVKVVKGKINASYITKFNIPAGVTLPTSGGAAQYRNLIVQYSEKEVMLNLGRADGRIFKGVIDETNKTINWTNLNKKAYHATYGGTVGATMFRMAGYEYLVYKKNATQIAIWNRTTNEEDLINYDHTSASSWMVHSINAVVDANRTSVKLYIYTGGISGGVHSYILTSKQYNPGVLNCTAVCAADEVYVGRQNVTVSWTAPANAASYDVYYQTYDEYNKYWSDFILLKGNLTATQCVHNDVKMFVDTDHFYNRYYRYKVVVTYNDGEIGAGAMVEDKSAAYAGYPYANVDNNKYTVNPVFMALPARWDTTMDTDPMFKGSSNNGIRNFSGYCKTELFWQPPSYGHKANAYLVYRDGVCINDVADATATADKDKYAAVSSYNFIDMKAEEGKTHKYVVRSVYNHRDEWAENGPAEEVINARNYAKPNYTISEIYNVPIDSAKTPDAQRAIKRNATIFPAVQTISNSVDTYGKTDTIDYPYGNFHVPTAYKQAAFCNGIWYVAQATSSVTGYVPDGYSFTTQTYIRTNPGSTESWSDGRPMIANSHGGILMFKAYTENDIKAGVYTVGANSDGYRIGGPNFGTYIDHNTNTGIAVDDEGTIFFKGKNSNFANYTDYSYQRNQNFLYFLQNGVIHTKDGNTYPIDFVSNGVDFRRYENGSVYSYTGAVSGRTDYYCMKGKLVTDGYAYLYIAPSSNSDVFVVKLTLADGSVKAEIVKQYSDPVAGYEANNENYAFPVIVNEITTDANGKKTITDTDLLPGEFMYQLRSRYYVSMNTTDGAKEALTYSTTSRVNSAGGCTLQFNGELFLITPMGQYSINAGNFYVGIAHREPGQATKDADLSHIIPAQFYYQDLASTGAYSDANGIWLHAEVPTASDELAKWDELGELAMKIARDEIDKDLDGLADYAYIYMFVPGIRFAKYRLAPTSIFPPTPVEINIEPQYGSLAGNETDGTKEDIKQYDAVATWTEVTNYGDTGDDGNIYYDIESYTLQIKDATTGEYITLNNGTTSLTVDMNTTVFNADGTTSIEGLTYVTTNDGYKQFTYSVPDVDALDDDGTQHQFVAEVVVGYTGTQAGVNDNQKVSSEKLDHENNAGFEAVAPTAEVNTTSTAPQGNDPVNNEPYNQWADWNGDGVKDNNDGYWMVYDVTIDIDEPETDEPVSYYVVEIDKDGDGTPDETVTVTEDGIYSLSSGEPFGGYPENGNAGQGMVPGTYGFADPDVEESVISFTLWDYVGGTDFNPEKGEPRDDVTDGQNKPGDWTYTVTAVYAGGNEKITQKASNPAETSYDGTTAVEVIGVDAYFSVYPIPASVSVTVKSSEAIEDVAIYTIAGVEVKAVDGNGANVMNVEVDDLAAGYYLLKVNDRAPVKIVVK